MEDNQGTIGMCGNPGSHARTRHIDIKFHYLRETVKDGAILLTYCPTDEMIADMFTKSLNHIRFEFLSEAIGMVYKNINFSN